MVQSSSVENSRTILLVEDDEWQRSLLRDLFEQKGYTVLEAENGREALRYFSAFHSPSPQPDILITDLEMPVMNGLDLLQELKEKKELAVFVFSASAKELKPCSFPWVDGFYEKPDGLKDLILQIEALWKAKAPAE